MSGPTRWRVRIMGLLYAALTIVAAPNVSSQTRTPALRQAIATGDIIGARHGDFARYREALMQLYGDSTTRALWMCDAGLTPQAQALLGALASAQSRGLRPTDYDVELLAQRVMTVASDDDAVLRLDAALSLAAMRFLDHDHRGRVDPRSLRFSLGVPHSPHDLAPLVRSLSTARDVHAAIDAVEPGYARYRALERTLSLYRALARDSTLTTLPIQRGGVRAGQPWLGTQALQRLLVALGDVPATAPKVATDTFAGALVDGVKHFQRRHGLAQDGVVGGATLTALTTPLSRRVLQIELAMERWRWLPDITSSRLVVVNIPAFRLYAFDRASAGERPVERMDVIVGSAYNRRHTPVFTGTMRSVVFQPYWDVPPSIARNEEIPRLRRDPGYADRQGLEIVRGGDVGAAVFPMTRANLDRVASGDLRLRQRPGSGNALGPVKFVFPNAFNVYLHGTPAQSLFARARRDFSHGCIRTSDPARLAEFVLKGQSGWNASHIAAAMAAGAPQRRVTLEHPLPVYILYTTVVVDDDGTPFFYPDLYGHDAALARLLGQPVEPRLVAQRSTGEAAVPQSPVPECLTDVR